MDIIGKFGNMVGNEALKDPVKARRLLLAGYRLQEKKLQLFPDRELPLSGQYAAQVVMKNIIQALAKPQNSAMMSIFVPGELLTAAGLTPYSVEALSCFIAGTKCEQIFLRKTEEEGFPETMCSYHRVFLGAALTGILPAPKCMIYTNLACDGNMMTFPYLKENTAVRASILMFHMKNAVFNQICCKSVKRTETFSGRHYRKENYRRSGGKCRYKQQKSSGTF